MPSWVAVAPGTMLATASPSRKRSFDTHFRRCCSSACMIPMIAGPPYDVAPSWRSVVAISFGSPVPVVSTICVAMASLLVDEESSHTTAFRTLTFVSGTRQDDPEQGAPSSHALELDPPSVRFHRPAGDRQTESGAARVSRPGLVDSIEALEDSLLVCRRDPGARVLDLDDRVAAGGRPRRDADAALGRREFDGVVEQVRDPLTQDGGVALHRDGSGRFDGQFLVLL